MDLVQLTIVNGGLSQMLADLLLLLQMLDLLLIIKFYLFNLSNSVFSKTRSLMVLNRSLL